jgi:high-affinity Fe2+/Pb2+ permease
MKTLLCATALFAIFAVGCKHKIEASQVEGVIKTTLKEKMKQDLKTANCPKEVEAKQGNNFECTGETTSGMKFVAKITQNDAQGNVLVSIEETGKPTAVGAPATPGAVPAAEHAAAPAADHPAE